ncbi:MAG TPA: hypothetical protein DET40_02015 [Lentisphaeria bacterium]|nr:hypothetical protein [Lentisphaeria bacterium]
MDSLDRYMSEVNQTPLLTQQQEHDLAVRMKEGDLTARDKLIEANLRLVVKIAHSYRNNGLELEDLIAEGNIAIMSAMDKYDPARGKLSTFLTHVVRNKIMNLFTEKGRQLHTISMNIKDEITGRELQDSIADNNDTDTDRMIAKEEAKKAMKLIVRVSPRQRMIIRLRFKERKKLKEIGEEMHMSGENVRLLLNDALEKLRAHMEDSK